MTSEKTHNQTFEIFKKCSPDGRLALYLEKRNFYDHLTHVDPIDGVLSFDTKLLKGQQVHLILTCGCRYGREDLDVLGLIFQKDLLICSRQIWPDHPETSVSMKRRSARGWCRQRANETMTFEEDQAIDVSPTTADSIPPDNASRTEEILTGNFTLSYTQKRLMTRLGSKCHPFRIKLPPFSPSSVTIQPSEDEVDKLCGVTYELSAFIGKRPSEPPSPDSGVSIVVRKLTQGPKINECPARPCSLQNSKAPVFDCTGTVTMNVKLDRTLFYHDEEVPVHVEIDNFSRLSVRKLRLSVVQIAELHMVTKGSYRSVVHKVRVHDGLPIASGTTQWQQSVVLRTGLGCSTKKRGLALDGLLRNEKPSLASSTIQKIPVPGCLYHETIHSVFGDVVRSNTNRVIKEMQGIIVSYVVRAQCWIGLSVLTVQVPFLLMHPPSEDVTVDTETTAKQTIEVEIEKNAQTLETTSLEQINHQPNESGKG